MSTPINWQMPVELIDGTPLVFSDGEQPDVEGHYRLVGIDGDILGDEFEQDWGGNTRVFVDGDGRWWLALDSDGPIVRNREQAA